MTKTIDLNADLGESLGPWKMGDDAALLDIVTSANIACGFHAGDPLVMAKTVALCKEKGVGIGAHPGFDDLRGFGRRRILGIPAAELEAQIIYQISALAGFARAAEVPMRHVKLHGALSNMASEDRDLAAVCVGAAAKAAPDSIIAVLAGTALEHAAAEGGHAYAREVFADRAYNADGTLVDRRKAGAVLHDPEEVSERVLRMVDEGAIPTVDGGTIPVAAQTVCVHGDNPAAVALAVRLRARLEAAGLRVAPMAAA